MNVSLILHFYQPPTQDEKVFRSVYDQSYLPILKLLRFYKSIRMTFNLPLSFLEQMEKYGYSSWIKEVKEYVDQERIELTGSGAYHPLLTEIPENDRNSHIILNEYSLGYYFGSHKGFEGENALLIKNVNGFFSPELAMDGTLLDSLIDLGYKWTVVEEYSLDGEEIKRHRNDPVFEYKDTEFSILKRNKDLSNLISFKKDSSTSGIFSFLNRIKNDSNGEVIATDAETFGHHNPEGIDLLESLIQYFNEKGIPMIKAGELIEDSIPISVTNLHKSSWSFHDDAHTFPLELWKKEGNDVHKSLWELLFAFSSKYDIDTYYDIDGFETVPIWKDTGISELSDEIRSQIELKLTLLKTQNSDQFWWASKETVNGKLLFNDHLILKNLELYKWMLEMDPDEKLQKLVEKAEETVVGTFGE